MLDSEADYLHTVEVSDNVPEKKPLIKEDLGIVNSNLIDIKCKDLFDLINCYQDYVAPELGELDYTLLMTVIINELPGSKPIAWAGDECINFTMLCFFYFILFLSVIKFYCSKSTPIFFISIFSDGKMNLVGTLRSQK